MSRFTRFTRHVLFRYLTILVESANGRHETGIKAKDIQSGWSACNRGKGDLDATKNGQVRLTKMALAYLKFITAKARVPTSMRGENKHVLLGSLCDTIS